jgi:hypothetical protein
MVALQWLPYLTGQVWLCAINGFNRYEKKYIKNSLRYAHLGFALCRSRFEL